MTLKQIGTIQSSLRTLDLAPMQGFEGAPDAWLEVRPEYADALDGICAGDDVILLTWLHLADRDVLKVHPRTDPARPLTGVFATRSPGRPNPIGLHRVRVRQVDGLRLLVGPVEALDGTPVVDIKPALSWRDDS